MRVVLRRELKIGLLTSSTRKQPRKLVRAMTKKILHMNK